MAAENAVRHLKGVKGVSNLIGINPRVSAGDVIHAIKKALHRAAQVDAEDLRGSECRQGDPPWKREDLGGRGAEAAFWAAPGVTNVQNDIRIVIAVGAQSATVR